MPTRLIFVLIALLLLIALPSFAEIYTEWLWFGEVGYQSVFLKNLTTRGLVGVGVFSIAFAVLFLNLRLAVRGRTVRTRSFLAAATSSRSSSSSVTSGGWRAGSPP